MVLADTNRFAGRLGLAPSDLRLRAWTGFDTSHVEVGTADGERFEWPLEVVSATPYDTRVMELDLDGSRLYFVADDPLRFADELHETLISAPTEQMTERQLRRSTRAADPLDRRTAIPVLPPTRAAPQLRRSVDRERLVPLGPKGKLRKPKRHAHLWQAKDATYGFTRYVCDVCRHVTIGAAGPNITIDLRERTIAGRRVTYS